MALSPETNKAFYREVDEEVRREQMESFARRWGVLVAIVVVLVLAAAGGWLYWQHHKVAVAERQGQQFDTAVDALGKNQPKDAAKPLNALADSKIGGYRALSRFTRADLLLQKNDLKGAAKEFGTIANDASLAEPYRHLALVRQTAAEYDDLKPQQVVQRLRPLVEKGSPWFGSAGEMVAIAYLRMNRPDLAGKLYGQIAAAPDVPDSIKQRAVQMAGDLGVDASGDTSADARSDGSGKAESKDRTAR